MDADALIDRRRLKRQLALWRVIGVLALVAVVAIGFGRAAGLGRAHVARLPVDGMITEDRARIRALDKLYKDDSAKALLVEINSPGGTTAGSEALFNALRRVAAKKPVVATIGTLGASGGYVVALAADRVFARESSLTGSIGVLLQTAEFSGLMGKLGIGAEQLTTGKLKGEPSPFKPLSEEGRAALTEVLQDSHQWFVGLVRERRQMAAEEAAKLADGRVFTGRLAMQAKLIDEIGGEREARAWLARERQVAESLPAVELKIEHDEDSWWRSQVSHSLASFGKSLIPERLTLDGLLSVWQAPGN